MYVLVGAGGHAGVVCELVEQANLSIVGFIDPQVQQFKDIKKIQDATLLTQYVMGIGGVTVAQLEKRHRLYCQYKQNGAQSLQLISNHAILSSSAVVGEGTIVCHRAIIQTNATIGNNVIINSGAIIEHDVIIEDGAHVAPGAIILGGAHIGALCMIGAGAVILPGCHVPNNTLVKSLTRYKNDK